MDRDTIYALSSGALPAGVAVIRLSGPAAAAALVTLAGPLPEPRKASLRTIRNRNGYTIDSGLILFFPGPNSFTGEDCGELQIHGGRAVAQALLDELAAQPGLRLAAEGEFSRRAFENGRLDLVEIEGLADLIAAETEMQRRLAVEHSSGGLSTIYDSWAERLTRARALIEAELDFADEEDVPGSVAAQVWPQMGKLRDEIAAHLKSASSGEIIRDGFKVVIAGAPNAGKSSLMNALARRDLAIVTDIPGTTRDVLEVNLDIAGFLVKLYDTAGLRETVEIIEREGIRRATRMLAEADLILYLHDLTSEPVAVDIASANARIIHVGTKLDLNPDSTLHDMRISTASGEGVADLLTKLESHLKCTIRTDSLAIPSRLRHKDSLAECLAAIGTAVEATDVPLDLRTEELRAAGNALGRITGRVDVENLLDVIFSEFCIGK